MWAAVITSMAISRPGNAVSRITEYITLSMLDSPYNIHLLSIHISLYISAARTSTLKTFIFCVLFRNDFYITIFH